MSLMSIGKFAKEVGVTTTTLRTMARTKELEPVHVSKGGTRYYSTEQFSYFKKNVNDKITIGYCRVSTPSQKDDLNNQVENMKTYMYSKGYTFNIITDIGSGINYNKKGLKELISLVNDKKIERIVVLYKDRLLRFGFEMLEYLCEINNVELVVIDNSTQSKEQELTDDLIQIITVFANRLYGSRSKKTKKLIDEVRNNDNIEKDTIVTD